MSHSLASSTGTRVESASKHIVPCKVATDYLMALVGSRHTDNAGRELQINKHKYCMAKDDIVMGLGRPMFGASVHNNKKKAYPSVITTLGQMLPEVRKFVALNNFLAKDMTSSGKLAKAFIRIFCSENAPEDVYERAAHLYLKLGEDDKKIVRFQIKNMIELYVVGVALGTAWAHPSSGDTVASVMIGGLKTVLNGAFPMHTNDPIMIYFEDERVLFEDDGGRKPRSIIGDFEDTGCDAFEKMAKWIKDDVLQEVKQSSQPKGSMERLRLMYHDRENGNYPATVSDGKFSGKIHIARYSCFPIFFTCKNCSFTDWEESRIKPYIVSRHAGDKGIPEHFPADKARIFAKAISNAQPFEKVDIMISRQSL